MTDIFKTKSGRIPENLIKTITHDDIFKAKIVTWSNISPVKANYSPNDNSAIRFRIPLSNDIADIFLRPSLNKSEHKPCIIPQLSLLCEYRKAEKQSINYYITSTVYEKQRLYPVNDDFACSYLDTMVCKKAELFLGLETTASKRFNTCGITVKGSNVTISHAHNSDTTTLSCAQWNELVNFVTANMTNIFETKSQLFSEKALRTITQDIIDAAEIEGISDATTMCFYIPLSDELIQEYMSWAAAHRINISENTDVMCEYWIDADECHYLLSNDSNGEIIVSSDDFSCPYLDHMVRVKYEKQYKEDTAE